MKPQGRRFTLHNAKWKVKEKGRNIKGWWEDVIAPSKTREKREARKDMDNIVDSETTGM